MTLLNKSILGLAAVASMLHVQAATTKGATKVEDKKAAAKVSAETGYSVDKAKALFAAELAYKVGPRDINEIVKDKAKHADAIIIDVRDAESFKKGHIPGAINIPNGDIKDEAAAGLKKDGMHYVYCYDSLCKLSQKVCADLLQKGYKVKEIEGGFDAWEKTSFPVEKGDQKAASETPVAADKAAAVDASKASTNKAADAKKDEAKPAETKEAADASKASTNKTDKPAVATTEKKEEAADANKAADAKKDEKKPEETKEAEKTAEKKV